MALPFKVSDLNAVPEAMRSAYVQKDGAFFIDVADVVPASEIEGLKKNRDDLKAEKQKAIADYQALLENSRLTDEERANLRARVDELESQVLTKEEIAAKAVKKAKEEAAVESAKIKAQSDHFQNLFISSTLEAAISAVSEEVGAYSRKQFHGLLAVEAKPRVEPVLGDDGKPTGKYVTMATITVTEGEKSYEKDVPLAEAAKHLAGLPENKNMFRTDLKAGGGAMGGRSSQGGAKTVTRSQFDSMQPSQKTEFVRAGGSVAD